MKKEYDYVAETTYKKSSNNISNKTTKEPIYTERDEEIKGRKDRSTKERTDEVSKGTGNTDNYKSLVDPAITHTVENISITFFTSFLTSAKVKKAITESDKIYKSLKGVSSGMPEALNTISPVLNYGGIIMDVKNILEEKSAFKIMISSQTVAGSQTSYSFSISMIMGVAAVRNGGKYK